MKKQLFLLPLAVFVMFFSLSHRQVLADGMMIKPDPYSDRWDYSSESNQQAFINYDDGLEKMIISVGLEGENNNGVVWLFPVPSEPDKIAIDVVKSLPKLSGEEISRKAKANLDDIRRYLSMTQLYTIPFVSFYGLLETSYKSTGMGTFSAGGNYRDIEQDVIVYEHLEKEGITSEIVTAKTANGLYNYLKNKGLKIERGSIPVLDNYIGKDYSFIASWINPIDKEVSPFEIYNYYNKKQKVVNQKGVFVTFPTKEIYFPLLPTSVYGSKVVPATIRIIGHVSPKIYSDIKSYVKTEYYVENQLNIVNDLKNFYDGEGENLKYTKIDINAPSKFLTDDLWMINRAPIKTYYSMFVGEHPIIIGLVMLIVGSITAGILVGFTFFKDLRRNPIKLGLIGLSNILTIVGLVITIITVRTKVKSETLDVLIKELKQKGYIWKRSFSRILFLTAVPLLTFGVLLFPGIGSLVRDLNTTSGIASTLIFYILPVIALIFSFRLNRVKSEDRTLFEQLKSSGYSFWSLKPKDTMKIFFIPVFSISFLIISWLLVKLVEFTV